LILIDELKKEGEAKSRNRDHYDAPFSVPLVVPAKYN